MLPVPRLLVQKIGNNPRQKKIALPGVKAYHSHAMQKYTFTLTAFTLSISCAVALGAPDTPETRRHEAERYLQATPPQALSETWPTIYPRIFRRINAINSSS